MSETYKSTKFYQLFQSLDLKEKKQFVKYLKQGKSSTHPYMLKLAKLTLAMNKDGEMTNNEQIFKQILGKQGFTISKMQKILSISYLSLENFLWLEYPNEKMHQQTALYFLEKYRESDLSSLYNTKYTAIEKRLLLNQKQSLDLFNFQRNLSNELATNTNKAYRTRTKNLINAPNDIDNCLYWNEVSYLLSSLLWLHNKLYLKKDIQLLQTQIQPIFDIIEKSTYEYPALLLSYYHLTNARFKFEDSKLYVKSWEYFKDHVALFEFKEAYNQLGLFQNYCVKKMQSGEVNFISMLFEINKFKVEQNMVLLDGQIASSDFKNIITTAIRNKELDWAKQFLTDYTAHLKCEEQDAIVLYHHCLLLFHSRDYSAARDLLPTIPHFKDVYYNLSLRTLEVQLYYEMQEDDLLEASIENYYIFIYRSKLISEENKILRRNFILLLKKIIKFAHLPEKLLALDQELKEEKKVSGKAWLLEKIQELS